jgi:cation diffusion facilitator CzcD-associated flavoprotein CzcO
MPKDYPDFPSSLQMIQYLNDYCDHFKFRENIQLNTEIMSCNKSKETGKWEIEIKNGKSVEKKVYKNLIICNGHHWKKRIPEIKGNFTGTILHSKDYKSPEILHGKRVRKFEPIVF